MEKSLVLFVELSKNDSSGDTSSGPLAVVSKGEHGWCWEDFERPVDLGFLTKDGFASYQEALADLLAEKGLSSGYASE